MINNDNKLKKPIGISIAISIVGIIIIILISMLLKKPKTTFKQNEVAKHNDVNYSITSIKRNTGDDFYKAKEGYEYINITLKIENKSKKEISYNALEWKIEDGNGNEKTYAVWGNSGDDDLNTGDLNSGETKTGTLSFEIPKGDNKLKLKYYETIFSKDRTFEFIITN